MVKLVVYNDHGNDKCYIVPAVDLITILPILVDFELDYMVYPTSMETE